MFDTTTYTAWQLARLAGCADPDSDTSEGADFLNGIESSVRESIEYNDGQWDDDCAHEIADGAVPVYTYRMWQTFTDLAAWSEDPSELGSDGGSMEEQAAACLYLIAARLASVLGEELEGDDEQ